MVFVRVVKSIVSLEIEISGFENIPLFSLIIKILELDSISAIFKWYKSSKIENVK